MLTDKPRVGRPPGPVDPAKRHVDEILGWIAVNKRIRDIVEKQLSFLESKLKVAEGGDTSLVLDDQLKVMAAIGSLLQTSSRVIDNGLKSVDRPAETKITEDPDEILESLQGGKG